MCASKTRASLDPDLRLLPEEMRRLAIAAGSIMPVERLVEAYGGRLIDVPKDPTDKHKLVRAIGIDTARLMVELLGSGRILVPLCHRFYRARTIRRILEMRARGKSMDEISKELRIHIRTLRRMISGQGKARACAR